MNIKTLLAKYGVDETKIAEATAEIQTAIDAELLETDKMSKGRFQEVYREKKAAQDKIAELEVEIETLNQTVASNNELISKADTYRQKLEQFEKNLYETQVKAWKDKEAFFKVDKSHKDFERRQKLMSKFTLTEEGKELTPEQIKANLEKFSVLEDAGIVDFKAPDPGINPPAPADKKPTGNSDIDWIRSQQKNK